MIIKTIYDIGDTLYGCIRGKRCYKVLPFIIYKISIVKYKGNYVAKYHLLDSEGNDVTCNKHELDGMFETKEDAFEALKTI